MREDKVRRKGKGKRGKREGRMGAKRRGEDYTIKEEKKKTHRILNIKGFAIKKKKIKYWISTGSKSMIHT